MKDIKLNTFKKSIENDAEKFIKVSEKRQQRIKQIISKSNEKNRITLRLNNQILELIRRKVQEASLPYQTYISSILYKYANDKLIDEKYIIRSIRLLNKS